MKISSVVNTPSNPIVFLVAALALSIGAAGNAHAHGKSCDNQLITEKNWLSNLSSDYTRSIGVVMVSNTAASQNFNATSRPEATYLNTHLNKGNWIFSGTLAGSGRALFNNREWTEDCGEFACPIHPFDPDNTDTWIVALKPADSAMLLIKPGQTFTLPLICDDHLMTATYTKYKASGNFIFPVSKTKYVLSLYRIQTPIPR